MKTLLTLIALTVTTLSANAGQIIPPPMLIKSWALTMSRRSSTYSPELSSIDYAKIVKQNPTWTKEAVKELFASIDPEKIKFAQHDSLDKVIVMVEPSKVRFVFEDTHRPTSPAVKFGVTTFYSLVGIERIQEKEAEQDGTGQPATRPKSKSEGSDKPQPESEGRSQ